MKARIVVYGDYEIQDETDVISDDRKQLEEIAKGMLTRSVGAESVEVFDLGKEKMIMRFVLTSRGKVKPARTLHPNWGGRREGSGRKPSANPFSRIISVRVTEELGEFLDGLEVGKIGWIRKAIEEKREREQGQQLGDGQ